jgi:hypothetical protein
VRFDADAMLRWIRVRISGDTRREPNERFKVKITPDSEGVPGRTLAFGRIRNDD